VWRVPAELVGFLFGDVLQIDAEIALVVLRPDRACNQQKERRNE
jgi:hypothetical protein